MSERLSANPPEADSSYRTTGMLLSGQEAELSGPLEQPGSAACEPSSQGSLPSSGPGGSPLSVENTVALAMMPSGARLSPSPWRHSGAAVGSPSRCVRGSRVDRRRRSSSILLRTASALSRGMILSTVASSRERRRLNSKSIVGSPAVRVPEQLAGPVPVPPPQPQVALLLPLAEQAVPSLQSTLQDIFAAEGASGNRAASRTSKAVFFMTFPLNKARR